MKNGRRLGIALADYLAGVLDLTPRIHEGGNAQNPQNLSLTYILEDGIQPIACMWRHHGIPMASTGKWCAILGSNQ